MSNRAMQILWFDIEWESGRRFQFPVLMNIFQELLDCAVDLAAVIGLVAPKASSFYSVIHASEDIIRMLMQLTDSLTKDRPYHLIDVAADKMKIAIKVK